MRAKKVILLAFRDPIDVSLLKVLLWAHGYAVLTAESQDGGAALFAANVVDMVLTDFENLVAQLKRLKAYVPVILLADREKLSGKLHCADALLDKKTLQSWELLERVRIMAARKRGPRKGIARVTATPSAEQSA